MAPHTAADEATTPLGRVRPRRLVGPLAAWLVLIAAALGVGWLRDRVFPYLGGYTSHVFATQLVVGAVVAVAWLSFSRTDVAFSRAELLLVGGCWTAATVAFDVLLVAARCVPVVGALAPYRVLLGPVWVLVPLSLLFAPAVVGGHLAGAE